MMAKSVITPEKQVQKMRRCEIQQGRTDEKVRDEVRYVQDSAICS